MVAGPSGPRGVRVPRSAEVDFKCARDHVTRPNPNMVALNAGEATTKPCHVTQNTVLVMTDCFVKRGLSKPSPRLLISPEFYS